MPYAVIFTASATATDKAARKRGLEIITDIPSEMIDIDVRVTIMLKTF